MIKIPCKLCIVFPICKTKVRDMVKLREAPGIWLTLYFECSIFSKFYDCFLTSIETPVSQVDDKLDKLFEIRGE